MHITFKKMDRGVSDHKKRCEGKGPSSSDQKQHQ